MFGAVETDDVKILIRGRSAAFKTPRGATAAGIEVVHQTLGLIETLDVRQHHCLGGEITKLVVGLFHQLTHAAMRQETREL